MARSASLGAMLPSYYYMCEAQEADGLYFQQPWSWPPGVERDRRKKIIQVSLLWGCPDTASSPLQDLNGCN